MYFLEEEFGALEVHLHAVFAHVFVEDLVVGGRELDAREQIACNAVEQRQVVVEELGQVDVDDGAQHQDVLVLLRVLQLQSHSENVTAVEQRHKTVGSGQPFTGI